MKILDKAYDWMIKKSKEDSAIWWLVLVAFLEGVISPLPPDPMLAIMVSVKQKRIFFYSLVCTLASVAGGFLGYILGAFLYDSVGKFILDLYGYSNTSVPNLNRIAFIAIALKALTPIPYKIVAIIAGFMHVDMLVFLSASLLSRFIRYYIVSMIFKKYGDFFLKLFAENKLLCCILMIIAIAVGFLLIAYI